MTGVDRQYPFFVYGTLLPGQPNYGYWLNGIVAQQPAVLRGACLYDQGFYPMLVEEDTGEVDGLLVTIASSLYEMVLDTLDSLEGYTPERPAAADYQRTKRVVQMADGQESVAWVYIGHAELTAGLEPIGRNWKRYARSRQQNIDSWWRAGGSVPTRNP
jgi:gamma-glutamylcyclotransferase (GGCT)/AIG2-like uncharacterized protein YtfP